MLDRLAARLMALHLDHPTRVAVDGVDAAGKTTLAVSQLVADSMIRAIIVEYKGRATRFGVRYLQPSSVVKSDVWQWSTWRSTDGKTHRRSGGDCVLV
jgi:hypothetical protein